MKKSLAVACLAFLLSACGTQSDARVPDSSSSAAGTPAETMSSAPESAAPSEAPPTFPAGAFVSVDCATGQQSGIDAAPSGTAVDGITATVNATGVPNIIVPAQATPAQTLGSAELLTGDGPAATAADVLTVDYCGVGLGSKALFDSSWQHGSPATFPLNGVIAGWQQGVPGMKVGGTRLLVIPGALAYGPNPPPGSGISSDETLIFVVTLRGISK